MKLLAAFLVFLAASLTYAGFDEGVTAYEAGDYAKALAEWRPLAEQGDAQAQYNLGIMHLEGEGVTRSARKAAEWFHKAGKQNHAAAQYNLATLYANGQGVAKNPKLMLTWLRFAAEQGYALAQYDLGAMYDDGQGVPQDKQQAAQWYRKAAEQGHADAQNNLGELYAAGTGVPRDPVLAYVLCSLAAANDSEDGTENRDKYAQGLTPEQIEQGKALAEKWKPGTPLPASAK
jgi:hypothetical protein